MSKKLTVLFAPINYVGPVCASIGIAQVLRDSGHRVVFAVNSDWKSKLNIYGFEEEIIGETINEDNIDCAERNVEEVAELFGSKSPLEKAINEYKMLLTECVKEVQNNEPFLEDIVKRIKPEVIVMDHLLWVPSLMSSGIPWVWSLSSNPLCFDWALEDPNLPPAMLGLPISGDREMWQKYREELNDSKRENWKKYNDWLFSKGITSLQEFKLIDPSPYLNIYMFPEELDYTDVRQLPKNFYRFDCFKRSGSEDTFELPEELRNRTGKLIYLSLGSMGSADIELMKRLIAILSKSKHRFIVSKGPLHQHYRLADNMWGQRTVPQIKVLSIIDLIITHGGNNTVTETMYFGKPLIVMPLFSDQFDNSQRIEEKGFGVQLNPYECTETELLEAIDNLLNDRILAEKLAKVSQRIQRENNILKVTKLIENLVE